MKLIYEINKWTIIVMLILYLSILGGILLQLLLAPIQLICFGIYIHNWSNIRPSLKPLLIIYGVVSIPLLTLLFIFPDTLMMFVWIIT